MSYRAAWQCRKTALLSQQHQYCLLLESCRVELYSSSGWEVVHFLGTSERYLQRTLQLTWNSHQQKVKWPCIAVYHQHIDDDADCALWRRCSLVRRTWQTAMVPAHCPVALLMCSLLVKTSERLWRCTDAGRGQKIAANIGHCLHQLLWQ